MISVIIPTYKRPQFLKTAINKLLDQTYKNFEILVIDDNGLGTFEQLETERLLKQYYDKRVKYYPMKINSGPSAARNYGIDIAIGEYVAFLDDDDYWLPTKLEKQVTLLKLAEKDVAVVYCWEIVKDFHTNKILYRHKSEKSDLIYYDLLQYNYVSINALVRKSVLVEIDGFDTNLGALVDWDLWLRIAQKYKFIFVPETLSIVFVHNFNRVTNNLAMKIDARLKIFKKHQKEIMKDKKTHAVFLTKNAILLFKNAEYEKCIITCKEAFVVKVLFKTIIIFIYGMIKRML